MQYAIVIEKPLGSSNYSAYVPDLPGCAAAAETLDEIKELMREAIEVHIEGMREDGLPIPAPSTEVATVDVAA
jgi:predicted RNase H-like HicB family nuclease